MKSVYLVRHCEATGQDSESSLTDKGIMQAKELNDFFDEIPLERIISSPYKRTVESCKAIAETKSLPIEYDDRLKERVLCERDLPDWREKLYQSFKEPDVKLAGGESSNEAGKRGMAVINKILASQFTNTLIVTHGNLLTLILNKMDNSYGYLAWMKLTNPDVYHLIIDEKYIDIQRVWKVNQ